MTTEELYRPHIEKAANAYAYSKALDLGLKVIQCSGFEGGISIICKELLKDGVVDPERLLQWLKDKTKVKPNKKLWWVKDKNN